MDGKRRRGKLFTNIGFKEDPNILYPRIEISAVDF